MQQTAEHLVVMTDRFMQERINNLLGKNAHADYLGVIGSAMEVIKRAVFTLSVKIRQSVSRAPRTRTTSKAAAKKAGGDSGDPDPEPRPLHSHACLTLPVFWQLLRPDNPGKNDLTNTQTDHATACASASAIVFWSCSK